MIFRLEENQLNWTKKKKNEAVSLKCLNKKMLMETRWIKTLRKTLEVLNNERKFKSLTRNEKKTKQKSELI